MNFIPIECKNWPRGQMFYYFSQMAPTSYSMTVNVDVTKLSSKLKQMNRKFFPTYLWIVTKCINRQIDFKVAYQNDNLGYYHTLTPLYAQFHDDDKTISLMWTEYDEDYTVFYRNYCENQIHFGQNHGVLCQPMAPPPANAYTVSCVPWIRFNHFAVHTHDRKSYFFPSIEAGKIFKDGERKLMPLSITCHHATTDGYHVDRFLKELQYEMDHFSIDKSDTKR